MALVDEMFLLRGERAYADASRQRGAAAAGSLLHDTRLRLATTLVGLLAAGLVLGVAGAAHWATRPSDTVDRDGLVDAVEQRRTALAHMQSDVTELRTRLDSARELPAPVPVPSPPPAALAAAGLAPLTGKGVAVSVGNSPVRDPALAFSVEDRDLQIVVNGLWAAGATGVSVNGRRLTSLTAIRTAGDTILVGYRPVVAPYVVLATGSPAALRAGFERSPAAGLLRDLAEAHGVVWSISARSSVTLPGAAAGLRLATGVPTPTAPTPTASPG